MLMAVYQMSSLRVVRIVVSGRVLQTNKKQTTNLVYNSLMLYIIWSNVCGHLTITPKCAAIITVFLDLLLFVKICMLKRYYTWKYVFFILYFDCWWSDSDRFLVDVCE